MNKISLIFILVLISSVCFGFSGALKIFNTAKPGEKLDVPYFYEAVGNVNTNFGNVFDSNCYSGKQYFLQTATPPPSGGYFVEFNVEIKKGDSGNFYLMGSCSPVGRDYACPYELYIDDNFIEKYDNCEVGTLAWGVSSAINWNNFGKISLTEGKHKIKFVVTRPRKLDNLNDYCQMFDALALVKAKTYSKPNWYEAKIPVQYEKLLPPQKTITTYFLEAENAESNYGSIDFENAYGKKHTLLETDSMPEKGFYTTFTVDVAKEKAGKFTILLASGPVGQGYASSLSLYVDGYFIKDFKTAPATALGWGYSNVMRWVCFGAVDLTEGEHTISFVVSDRRAIDQRYCQFIDCLSLIAEEDMNVPATIKIDKENRFSFNSNTKQNLKIKATLVSTTVKEPLTCDIPVKLMRKGQLVKEYVANITVDPKNVGKSILINLDMQLLYNLPTGGYYIISDNVKVVDKKPLATLSIKGVYPSLAKKLLAIKNLKLVSSGQVDAGSNFKFRVNCDLLSKVKSNKLTVILEYEKDLAYLAKSYDISDIKNASGKYTSKEFVLSIPKDIPNGSYKVLLGVNGVIYETLDNKLVVKSKFNKNNTSVKALSYGFYKDNTGVTQTWYSTPSHALIWDGEPFMPMSGMFNGPYMSFQEDEETFKGLIANIEELKKHNIKHVYLFTQGSMEAKASYSWEFLLDYLEKEGFTYVIGYCSGSYDKWDILKLRTVRANESNAIIVKNVNGVVEKTVKNADIQLHRAGKILNAKAFAIDKSGNVLAFKDATIKEELADGVVLKVEFDNINVPYDVAFAVGFESSLEIDNPWKNWEAQYKSVATKLKSIELRPGFRGFVDFILTNERGIYNSGESLFIETPEFMAFRANQLKNKYKDINSLKKAWKVEGDFVSTFEEASKLYPIYSNKDTMFLILSDIGAGTSQNNKIYRLDAKDTNFWYEYIDLRDESYSYYQNLMIDKVREIAVDVPVVIKRCGVTERYHSNPNKTDKGVDGVGNEIYATGEGLVTYGAGFGYIEMETAGKDMIGYSTEFGRGWGEEMPPNWPDIHGFFYDMAVAQNMCSKITYLFLLDVLPHNTWRTNNILGDPRILEWMNLWEELLLNNKEKVVDYKPYVYTSWPRPDAWWPSPSERRSVRDVSDAYGINITKASNGVWILPTFDSTVPSDVTFVTLNDNPGTDYYKADFEKLLKKGDREIVMVGHRKNLGDLSIDKYYTSEFFEDGNDVCQVLKVPEGAEIIQETNGKVWAMKVGKLQIVAREPKKCYSLEGVVKYAKVPENVDITRRDATGFLNRLLGVEFATYNKDAFKATSYKLDGKDVSIIHTTSKVGGETLKIKVPVDAIVELPYTNTKINAKANETVSVVLPKGHPEDKYQGGGLGYVKITGVNLKDIIFEGLTKDAPGKITAAGFERSALAEGFILPIPKRIQEPKQATIEVFKALAGFDNAMDAYKNGEYANAEQWLKEWRSVAGNDFIGAFNFALGNVRLLRGDVKDSIEFYKQALVVEPNNADLKTAYACALYANGDVEAAKKLWQEANTKEALENLKK